MFRKFCTPSSPQVVRTIHTTGNEVFLTFDDGPDINSTPQILDILKHRNARASFFVIGQYAKKHPELIKRIITEGHSIFSHSVDHYYRYYFKKRSVLRKWVTQSLEELSLQTQLTQKCFRPPAGILTSHMLHVAKELNIPLILWKHRFFDTVHHWTERKANHNVQMLVPGDIILLHDKQKISRINDFLVTLNKYIQGVHEAGLRFAPICQNTVEQQVHKARSKF